MLPTWELGNVFDPFVKVANLLLGPVQGSCVNSQGP